MANKNLNAAKTAKKDEFYTQMTDIEREHQHDPNANNLWSYFQNVLNWAITNFDMKKFKKTTNSWRATTLRLGAMAAGLS